MLYDINFTKNGHLFINVLHLVDDCLKKYIKTFQFIYTELLNFWALSLLTANLTSKLSPN